MKQVSKSKLKSEMLAYFRDVESTKEPLTVTDHGIPVLQVIPILAHVTNVNDMFSDIKGKVKEKKGVWDSDPSEWGNLA